MMDLNDRTITEEIEEGLYQDWIEKDFSHIGQSLSPSVKQEVRRAIVAENRQRHRLRYFQYAAVILCLLFTGGLFFLGREKAALAENEICVSTGKGEKANVTLPDGTFVRLGGETEVNYKPGEFNKKTRSLRFKGEAYFSVAKNPDSPFKVFTGNMSVTVTGTKFLLVSRSSSQQEMLLLDEGSVDIVSNISDQSVSLVPGQEASLNLGTGMFSIYDSSRSGESAFEHTLLSFNNIKLQEVLDLLSETYNVRIEMRHPEDCSSFTGHLPSDDLSESLNILSKAYGFKIDFSEGYIRIAL